MRVHKEQRSNAMLALDNCKHESGFSVMEADELFFINGGSGVGEYLQDCGKKYETARQKKF